MPAFLTVRQAAKTGCVMPETIRTWIRNGKIKAYNIHNQVSVSEDDVLKLAHPPCPACGMRFFRAGRRYQRKYCSDECENSRRKTRKC